MTTSATGYLGISIRSGGDVAAFAGTLHAVTGEKFYLSLGNRSPDKSTKPKVSPDEMRRQHRACTFVCVCRDLLICRDLLSGNHRAGCGARIAGAAQLADRSELCRAQGPGLPS